jgi:hypothetical protein
VREGAAGEAHCHFAEAKWSVVGLDHGSGRSDFRSCISPRRNGKERFGPVTGRLSSLQVLHGRIDVGAQSAGSHRSEGLSRYLLHVFTSRMIVLFAGPAAEGGSPARFNLSLEKKIPEVTDKRVYQIYQKISR